MAIWAVLAPCWRLPFVSLRAPRPCRSSRSIRSGPSRCPTTGCSARSASVAVDSNDHVWVLQRPRSLTDDEKGATLKPPRNKCCVPAPSVMEFDADGNFVQGWGGPDTKPWVGREHGIFVDQQGLRLAGRQRRQRQRHLQVQPRRQARADDRQARPDRRQQRHHPARQAGRHPGRRGGQRGLRRRRLRQPPRHRVRCRHRRLQAPLGRLRPEAERRQDSRSTIRPRRCRSSSAIPCTAPRSRTTASSMSATARTTASRSSRRTAPTSPNGSTTRRRWATARCGTSISGPTPTRPTC